MSRIKLIVSKAIASFACFFICMVFYAKGQTLTNSINIGSAQQTINPATFNAWIVTAESAGMQAALCYLGFNSAAPAAPPANTQTVTPVALNQPALVLQAPSPWANGTYLSCYPFNTLYTVQPAQSNSTNTTMTIRRRFNVCSNTSQNVTLNFSVRCDDYVNAIILDAGTANQQILFQTPTASLANPVQINNAYNLVPGTHTIDVVCGDWEESNAGSYFQINNTFYQWNPFGVSIVGSITSATNVLLNGGALAITPITSTADSMCVDSSITLSDATPGGTWSSSNTGVATVSAGGVVTGVSAGNVIITYTIGQGNCTNSASYNITVENCHCEDPCSWSLTGNTNVLPGNFIGSINSADFKIRTANTQKMVVKPNGYVGIGTPDPHKTLEVVGETRITNLPGSQTNDRLIFANSFGDLHSLDASGNINQYLSGNGSWQNIPPGSGIINAGDGLTTDGTTVSLGDYCNRNGGLFSNDRKINMNGKYLYFNSSERGKLYMGNLDWSEGCKILDTRLEIGSAGLRAVNNYDSPLPSTSGLRFSDLNARMDPIENRYDGVLSLDADGDVIWVRSCCTDGPIELKTKLDNILERLTKLEDELKASKNESAVLKQQLNQMDVLLAQKNTIILNQNVPNPFEENTVITYNIPKTFRQAQIIFTSTDGQVIKTAEITQSGKGQVNVFAKDISSGLYTYTLIVDGKTIDTKKMVKR